MGKREGEEREKEIVGRKKKKRERNSYPDVIRTGETIELIQQLQHCSLHFTITRDVAVKSLCSNGIQLVNENDCRFFLFRKSKSITHKFGTITDEHLDKLGTLKRSSLSGEGRKRKEKKKKRKKKRKRKREKEKKTSKFQKTRVSLFGTSPRHQSFSSSRRTIQQNSLGRLNS